MAGVSVPEWLGNRGGELKPGISPHIVFVMLGGKPQYRLDVRPAGGQFTCGITQTVNGKRLDNQAKFTTLEAALVGGLSTLRDQLGW
jgi:hypothetical protein